MTTASDKRKAIIEKVAKLSTVAGKDSGAFQGEMENAARMISRLMDEYAISWGEVEEVQGAKGEGKPRHFVTEMTPDGFNGATTQWQSRLANTIADVTHTRMYMSSGHYDGRHFAFYGDEINAQMAVGLLVEWSSIITRMAVNAYSSRFKKLRAVYGRGEGMMDRIPATEKLTHFKESFMLGIADGMKQVVDENKKSRTVEMSTALVVVDGKLTTAFNEMTKGWGGAKVKHTNISAAGYADGLKVGKSIDISAKKVSAPRAQAALTE